MKNDWLDYLKHRGKEWQRHKYLKKLNTGSGTRYFYSMAELEAFYRDKKNETIKVEKSKPKSKKSSSHRKRSKGANYVAKKLSRKSTGSKKNVEGSKKQRTVTAAEAKAAWDIWNKGKYGNGEARKRNLKAAGLNYKNVQAYINELVRVGFDTKKMKIKVADEKKKKKKKNKSKSVISGKAKINKRITNTKKASVNKRLGDFVSTKATQNPKIKELKSLQKGG